MKLISKLTDKDFEDLMVSMWSGDNIYKWFVNDNEINQKWFNMLKTYTIDDDNNFDSDNGFIPKTSFWNRIIPGKEKELYKAMFNFKKENKL